MSYLVNDRSHQISDSSSFLITRNWINDFVARLAVLSLWFDKHQQRKQLAQLESYRLKDLGITSTQVNTEINKPFWK